ncbi:MAG: T9SS type A sorting domain-containing protein [candidate division WOR-3 bacterium]
MNWQELKPPPVASPIPPADAALCYMGNPVSSEEKVLAVFSGDRYLWSYDVPSDTWYQEIPIGGSDSPGAGASLKFGGFRVKEGIPVNTFYLIKGGRSCEFMVYNRPYVPAKGGYPSFPYWELLAPFMGGQGFHAGADLAMYHPDPYKIPAPDTIFAMRGYGKLFGLYRISQNCWELRDSILDDGAYAGGALVSHPRWGDIRDDDPPFEEESSYSVNSILHCFRGENREGKPTYDFDCYDVYSSGSERWNGDAPNPVYKVSSGSDLCFGGIWYRYNGQIRFKECIWASFGGKMPVPNWYIGIHYRNPFLWEQNSEPGGSQSAIAPVREDGRIKVLPSVARDDILFHLSGTGTGEVCIYSGSGQLVRHLQLNSGSVTWDLKTEDGKKVPAGVYIYQVQAGGKETRGKLTIRR